MILLKELDVDVVVMPLVGIVAVNVGCEISASKQARHWERSYHRTMGALHCHVSHVFQLQLSLSCFC